jgi:DNA-binding GntR family transcriptional regulator
LSDRIPRYLQIASTLRRRISTAAFQTSQRLPSETELATQFRVSRETVRSALRLLREEGSVHSMTGRGTFTSPGRRPRGVRITLPISDPYIAGRPSVMQILQEGLTVGPPEVARALAVPARTPLYCYTFLRTIKGKPFRYCKVYLPETVWRLLDGKRSPRVTVSEKLEREAGLRLIRCTQSVSAAPAPPDAAEALKVRPGTSLLLFRYVLYDAAGRPVEVSMDLQDSARFPYEEVFVSSRQ